MSGKKANPGYRNPRHVPKEMHEEVLRKIQSIFDEDHSLDFIRDVFDNLLEKERERQVELYIQSGDNSGRRTALEGGLKRGLDINIAIAGPGIKKKKNSKEEEVSKKLKAKWRQIEEKDNKDSTSIINDKRSEGTSAVATPKLGKNSKYIDALQSFVGHIIKKKVHNKEVWAPITPDDADKFMEIARAVAGLGAVNHLLVQVKLLTECPSHSESIQVSKNLHPNCYDQSRDLSGYEKIIKLVLETVRNQMGTSTRRIEYRHNCVLIARFYKAEQDKETQLQNANPSYGKVSKRKGVTTEVRRNIIWDVGCTVADLDAWIKASKAFTPFIDQFGFGVLGLFPNDISNSKILELSMLIEEHLLIHLLNWSRPSAQLLRDMLARAKELKLQIPFKKVLNLDFIEEEKSIAELRIASVIENASRGA
ncbi:MAG: hypothetical protein M1840_008513 [Geoglossum simile]|nr:MAG: hypothetical protein M1840_008513 [Geoglossum simile]